MSRSFLCPYCGLSIRVPEGHTRPKVRCGECGVIAEIPASLTGDPPEAAWPPAPREAARPPEKRAPRPPSDVVPRATVPPQAMPPNYAAVYIWGTSEDEENSDPYPVADPARPRCPNCDKELEYGSVVCLRCGFDRREGRRHVREYEPLVRRWEAGLSVPKRVGLFLVGEAGAVVFGLIGAWFLGDVVAFVAPWLIFTLLTAFLLGTYDRLDLTRDRRGRVELLRTWHVCFWRFAPAPIDLRLYEGVATGKDHDAGFFEWLVFFSLLPAVVPALVWWWVAIRQPTITVALTRDHGYADEVLYRGWNQEQARELAATLADAARLAYRPG